MVKYGQVKHMGSLIRTLRTQGKLRTSFDFPVRVNPRIANPRNLGHQPAVRACCPAFPKPDQGVPITKHNWFSEEQMISILEQNEVGILLSTRQDKYSGECPRAWFRLGF